jgi:hypothetical protein
MQNNPEIEAGMEPMRGMEPPLSPQERVEEYLDNEEISDQQERMEDQSDDAESAEWADIPQKRKQDSLYTLFNKVWKSPDSSKVANLHPSELGKQPLMTVRDAQYLSLLGVTLKHPKFAKFFKSTGEITLSTSASKKGWFTELFVSQKKFTTRAAGSFGTSPEASQKKKWSLFGGGEKTSEQPQTQPGE